MVPEISRAPQADGAELHLIQTWRRGRIGYKKIGQNKEKCIWDTHLMIEECEQNEAETDVISLLGWEATDKLHK